jgi:hypothetical protein
MQTRPLIQALLLAAALVPGMEAAAGPIVSVDKVWSTNHGQTGLNTGVTSEIAAFDAATNTIWVAGVVGVDVLNAGTGALVRHIDTSGFGSVNSVAVKNGVAAFAIENKTDRTQNGTVQFYNTATRANTGSVGRRRPARHADLHARWRQAAGSQRGHANRQYSRPQGL